jgi:solute carrier family 8 (sodium/calcium exchanger)
VDYATSNGVAVAGTNYAATKGTLVFEDGETVKEIVVKIILDVEPEQNMNFCVNLSNPEGGASLSKANMSVVTILDDEDIEEVTDMVAQLLAARDHASHPQGGWKEQFVEAVQCEGSVDHLGQEIPPGAGAMLLHCFSLPWKLLFATIPPTGICNGWATFIVALIYIGIITAVVGDVAGQLGEAMGLKPLVSLLAVTTIVPTSPRRTSHQP